MAVDLQGIVDHLVGLDEDAIVTVMTSVMQARPEIAPPVVSFAVPDLTYPPQKALVDRRCNGTIKSYNDAKGFGFIQCEELTNVFGNDVFMHASQCPPGCQVGMPVNFAVVLNTDNKPQAYDLQPPGGAKGGAKGGKTNGDPWTMMMMMKGDGWKGGGSGGKDGWKGGYMDSAAEMMMMMKGKGVGAKGGKGGEKGYGKEKGDKGGGKSPAKPLDNVDIIAGGLRGTIKSFNPTSGYGFIDCPDTKAQYGNDVFLHHAQVADFKVGDIVEFSVFLNQSGKPQAKDLQEPEAQVFGGDAKRQKVEGGGADDVAGWDASWDLAAAMGATMY